MPVWLMLTIMGLLLTAAVIRQLPWRDWAVKWVGDNPARAQFYIKSGQRNVQTFQGHRVICHPAAQIYYVETYTEKFYIFVPGDGTDDNPTEGYPYEYIRGRRIIGLHDGQLVASPLGFMSPVEKRKYRESVTAVSAVLESAIFTSTVQSVKKPKTHNNTLTILLILVAVAVVGYYVYTNYIATPEYIPGPSANVTQTLPAQENQWLEP